MKPHIQIWGKLQDWRGEVTPNNTQYNNLWNITNCICNKVHNHPWNRIYMENVYNGIHICGVYA